MNGIAKLCLLLMIGVCAGCTAHSASGPCGGCGYDRPQSYRESTYESDRYERTPGYDDRAQVPRSSDKVDRNRPDVRKGDAPATTYTCPMHPEVNQTTPGTCPKCGMQLVRKR
jgi:hypothetical protein